MRLSRLLSILALFALLFAPASMIGGHAAMAMPHQTMASSPDHCAGEEAPPGQDEDLMTNCALACAAMPAAAPLMNSEALPPAALPEIGSLPFLDGTRPEATTPPPRFS